MNQASDNGVTSLINYKNGEFKANAYNLTTVTVNSHVFSKNKSLN